MLLVAFGDGDGAAALGFWGLAVQLCVTRQYQLIQNMLIPSWLLQAKISFNLLLLAEAALQHARNKETRFLLRAETPTATPLMLKKLVQLSALQAPLINHPVAPWVLQSSSDQVARRLLI